MSNAENLDDVIKRLCSLEAPLNERLKLFSEALHQTDPRYQAAYEILIERLEAAKSGCGAPDAGDVLPPFALPDGDLRVSMPRRLSA